MRRVENTTSGISLKSLVTEIERGTIVFNNTYQREYIWKKAYKEELLQSIFSNFPIGGIIIWDTGERKEIIDGLQRLKTITAFACDELTVSSTASKIIVDKYKKAIGLENTPEAKKMHKKIIEGKNILLKYSKLPICLRQEFDVYQASIVTIRNVSDPDIRSYFIKVQNQEKLKSGEIIRSLPQNELVRKINKLEIDNFSHSLNFDNKRNEMEKLIAMFHGVHENKIPLNASSTRIIAYTIKNDKISDKFFWNLNNLINDSKSCEIKLTTKAQIKILFIARLLSNELQEISISKLAAGIIEFVSETKVLFSNDPKTAYIRSKFISQYPNEYQLTSLLRGQQKLDAIMKLMPTFISTMKRFIYE